MNLLVVGASRGTGALVVRTALDRDHRVTAFSRSPQKLGLEHPHLTLYAGDFHDAASVAGVMPGHDAVVVTASGTSLAAFKENPNYFSAGTALVIAAMKAHGVRRLVILSALGAGDSRQLANFFIRTLVVDGILRRPFADHDRQERLAMDSGLEYVIVRPGRLTDGPAKKQYIRQTGSDPVPGSISRADVADFLVEAAETDQWVGKAVQLGG